ncbi:MAG: hypothetical protein K2N94_08855 [Lachnospiraceae bacterium]|nr:hypothetical protein [Lachnospiraceae bacterium]
MATLKNLIRRTKVWIRQVNLMYHGKIGVELLADEEYFLRYIIETKHYLAELVVEPDGFHPYRHVSFTAFDLDREDTSSYAYCYYDDEESTEDDIFNCLDEAISYILS